MPDYDDIRDIRRAYDKMLTKADVLEHENKILKLRIKGLEDKAKQEGNELPSLLHQIIDGLYASGLPSYPESTTAYAVVDEISNKKLESVWLSKYAAEKRIKQLGARYTREDPNKTMYLEVRPMTINAHETALYRAAYQAGWLDGFQDKENISDEAKAL